MKDGPHPEVEGQLRSKPCRLIALGQNDRSRAVRGIRQTASLLPLSADSGCSRDGDRSAHDPKQNCTISPSIPVANRRRFWAPNRSVLSEVPRKLRKRVADQLLRVGRSKAWP